MKNISKKQFILLCVPPILCISMLLLVPFLTNKIGRTVGYIAGFCIYWFIFCLPFSLYYINKDLKKIYCQKSNIKKVENYALNFATFLPCILLFLYREMD